MIIRSVANSPASDIEIHFSTSGLLLDITQGDQRIEIEPENIPEFISKIALAQSELDYYSIVKVYPKERDVFRRNLSIKKAKELVQAMKTSNKYYIKIEKQSHFIYDL